MELAGKSRCQAGLYRFLPTWKGQLPTGRSTQFVVPIMLIFSNHQAYIDIFMRGPITFPEWHIDVKLNIQAFGSFSNDMLIGRRDRISIKSVRYCTTEYVATAQAVEMPNTNTRRYKQ